MCAAVGAQQVSDQQYRFKTGIELINVTATVTDADGRFVEGLAQDDFLVFDDNEAVEISHFAAERVPLSLGIILDTSASMTGEKLAAARTALDRFLVDLLGPDDEVFLYRFADRPELVHGWTTDRAQVSAALGRVRADGATALYDAVVEALPLLASGKHRKKALLVISDGNDTNSRRDLATVSRLIRDSDALLYAIGIDAPSTLVPARDPRQARLAVRGQRRRPIPIPFPMPGTRPPPRTPPMPIPGIPPGPATPRGPIPDEPKDLGPAAGRERVDASTLRKMTDESGGRTEVIRDARDLGPATSRIAEELSNQYFFGYLSPGRHDGQWHVIRVEIRNRNLRVRARRGYLG